MTGPALPINELRRDTIIQKQSAKAPTAYRTISEAADELGVPQHVLRFWETKFSQIRPMKRSGGRRFYRPEDIDVLRTIQTLLYDNGYTIKGVQRLLKLRRGLQSAMDAIEHPALAEAPEFATETHYADDVVDLTDDPEMVEGEPALPADDLFAAIPDHLPAKPASLMAEGLMQGNPLPPAAPASVATNLVPSPAHAPSRFTTDERLQLQAMLAELKALKTLLN